ncbi:hypothetical protein FRC07_013949, partial [Ceratobasidium sp. 392]
MSSMVLGFVQDLARTTIPAVVQGVIPTPAGEIKSAVTPSPIAGHGSRLGYTTKVIEETGAPVITAHIPRAETKEKSGEHVQCNTAASDSTSASAPSFSYTELNTVSTNTFSELSVTTYLSSGVNMESSVPTNVSTPGETKLDKLSKSKTGEVIDNCTATTAASQPLVPVPEVVLVLAHDSAPAPTAKSCQISSSRVSICNPTTTPSANSTHGVDRNSSCGQTVALGSAPGRSCVPAPAPCPTSAPELKCQHAPAPISTQFTHSQSTCQTTHYTDCKGSAKNKVKKDTKADCAPALAKEPNSRTSAEKYCPPMCEPKKTKQNQQKRDGCENVCEPSSSGGPPAAPCSTSASCQKTDNTDCKGPAKDKAKKDTKTDYAL